MYKRPGKFDLNDYKDRQKDLIHHVWPGGYPVYYVAKDGGILCPHCANQNLNRIEPEPELEEFNQHIYDWLIIDHPENFNDHFGDWRDEEGLEGEWTDEELEQYVEKRADEIVADIDGDLERLKNHPIYGKMGGANWTIKKLEELYTPDDEWNIVGADVNWEDNALQCDNCNDKIEVAYETEEEEE